MTHDKPSVNQAAGGTKRRKMVRRLVDKMYIDDDGSMGRTLLYYTLHVNCCHSYRERMERNINR